jgi:hypothetical protein
MGALFPPWYCRSLTTANTEDLAAELEGNLRELESLWNAQREVHYQVLHFGVNETNTAAPSPPDTVDLYPLAFPIIPIAFSAWVNAGECEVQLGYDDGGGATDLLVSNLTVTGSVVLNQFSDFTTAEVGVGDIYLSVESVTTNSEYLRCLFTSQSLLQLRQ